ncbi:DUF2892 domain-containing protein [Castellaniella daejeonensis]|jgi:hypothetical protein|uniref:DUF2892 domain-containing protein n=1 Tax=Castellaniella daejeonensis TaxID=659013 RepID=A0ABN0TF07_9BURK
MTSWQLVRVLAGLFILLSLLLGAPASPWFHSQWWLAFTVFVGLNILQSGVTKWCLLERIMHRLGARRGD